MNKKRVVLFVLLVAVVTCIVFAQSTQNSIDAARAAGVRAGERADWHTIPVVPSVYSDNPSLERAYLEGFERGKEIKRTNDINNSKYGKVEFFIQDDYTPSGQQRDDNTGAGIQWVYPLR